MANGLPQAEVDAIKVALQKALDAFDANDIETWLSHLTEDAVLMPPGVPACQGREQLKAYRESIESKKYTLSDIHIDGRDDLAVLTTAMGFPFGSDTVNGKQIMMYKKIAGKWLLAAACFNMDVPGKVL